MQKHVVIVGGGLIGLTSALMLHERGASVTVVETATLGSGAARGNAGFFAPVLMAPLAAPGMMLNSLKSLASPTSPLRIHPRALPSMGGWGLTFLRASNEKCFRAGQAALAALNAGMHGLLDELRELGVAIDMTPEIVVPFRDEAFAERFFADCDYMARFGLEVPTEILGGDEIRRIVPALTDHVRAGFVLPGNHAADPRRYVDSVIPLLDARGVAVQEGCRVTGFDRRGGRVLAVRTDSGVFAGDEIVLASGAGIRALGRMLDLSIPVIPGQGYNVALPLTERLQHPVIVEEVHAVATPFGDRIRLGGTMEFAGDQPPFNQKRVDAILRSMRPYLDLDWSESREMWAGSRPMSADGLPIIGRPKRYENVIVAGGHGMYGYTLAPVTATSIADLVIDGRSTIDLTPFRPDR